MVVLHSQDSNGLGQFEAFWRSIADSEQLVVVIPKGTRDATNPSTYPDGANWRQIDMPQVQELTQEIDDCYNVDTKRHILWGFSAGCQYGYLLGVGAAANYSGLAMGGCDNGFASSVGYPASEAAWAIPVSHVHGQTDFNPISRAYVTKSEFETRGSVFTLYEHPGGHTISAEQVRQQYDDLKNSQSP